MKYLLLLAIALAHVPAWADPAALRNAASLIGTGKPAEALTVLQPLRGTEAANPEYHYLVGIAHLDTGDLAQAIAALEQSLALDPRFLQAKAELGRAYALNYDSFKAYQAFAEVRAANPPPEAVAGMERFLDEVARSFSPRRPLSGSLSMTVGRDSNANFGPTVSEVALPIFGGVPARLSPQANPQEDEFLALGGHLALRQPLNQEFELVGSVVLNARRYRDLEVFDIDYGNALGGARYTAGAYQLGLIGIFERLDLGGSKLRTESGFSVDWRYLLGGPVELELNYRRTDLDYSELDSFRDAAREVFGVALRPSLFGRRLQQALPYASFYYGTEHPRNPGAETLGYEFAGARSSYYHRLWNSMTAFVAGGYEERRYDAPDPVFLEIRHDRQFDASLGAAWDLTRTLALVPAVWWTESRSNLDVYAYRRILYTISLQQVF